MGSKDRVISSVEDLRPGDHACAIFDSDDAWLDSLVPYLRCGVQRREKLLCIRDGGDEDALRAALAAGGLELAAGDGQLLVLDAHGLCEQDGRFEPEQLASTLRAAQRQALAEGFSGLRVTGEMTWALRVREGADLLRNHLSHLSGLFTELPALGLCQYDRRRFGSEVLLELLRTCPIVVLGGEAHPNPYHLPAEQFLGGQREAWELAHALEHIRAQSALTRSLRDSERRYRLLFDSLIVGFALHEMIFDADGQPRDYRFLEVNPAFEALTGLLAKKILGRRVLEIMPALEREWIERYGRVVHSGVEDRFRMFSSPLQRHYEVVAYRSGPGRFATVFSDITDIVLAEQRRIEADRRLFESQKLDSLGLLAGGIAHDFNNMLMGVLGNASLALDDVVPGSALEECLQDIEAAAKSAAGLAKQLLAYSGRGRFVVEPVDIAGLVREMGKLLEASIPKSVRIRYQFDPDVGTVMADVSQVRQVLMNLILNAAQAIGERSGIITIAISSMDCDLDYLTTTFAGDTLEEGRYVYLEVTDTGDGMDAATQQRIFDPFFTTKETGRGLGLAATLGIVRGHRGAIKVYSEPRRGTTFKVLLPRHGEAAPEASVVTAELSRLPPQARGVVLVVDDEEHVRRVASRILRSMGFEVLAAEDGREALAIYRSHQDEIVLVLLDMMMPRLGGERTFTELRRIQPNVRVVLSSGYNEQEAVDRFVGRGLAGFIQKPYPKAELERVVLEALK